MFSEGYTDIKRGLSRETTILLNEVEDDLYELYSDFGRRICEWLKVLRKKDYVTDAKGFEILKEYQDTIERVISKEEEDQTKLQKLSKALEKEIENQDYKYKDQIKALAKNLKELEAILTRQHSILISKKLPKNTKTLEKELERELDIMRKFIEECNDIRFNQIAPPEPDYY